MPELPEVETTLRGIEPHILNKEISSVNIRQPSLRWPVPTNLIQKNWLKIHFLVSQDGVNIFYYKALMKA